MTDEDPRRVAPIFQPDVIAYRLGQVEQETHTNSQDIAALTATVHEFIAAMPANYVPRREHDATDLQKSEMSVQKLMLLVGLSQVFVTIVVNGILAVAVGH